MKRKELFWMIVPCLCLFFFGWWIQGQENPFGVAMPPRTDGPFGWRVVKIEHLPLSSQEVEDGYDAKCRVEFGFEGSPPVLPKNLRGGIYNFTALNAANVRFTRLEKGKEVFLGKPQHLRLTWVTEFGKQPGKSSLFNQKNILTVLVAKPKNEKLRHPSEQLFFKSDIAPQHYFNPPSSKPIRNRKFPSPSVLGTPQPFSLPL